MMVRLKLHQKHYCRLYSFSTIKLSNGTAIKVTQVWDYHSTQVTYQLQDKQF